jgi:hypothetical protein
LALQATFDKHVEGLSKQVSSLEDQVFQHSEDNLKREQNVMASLSQLAAAKEDL